MAVDITALVSLYRAARYVEACLDDLIRQSVFAQGRLEVIIIDSASPEDEGRRVQPYLKRFPEQIRYSRSPERETLYAAWNRAAALARGQYFTNANADDLHAPDCLAELARALDANAGLGMVYSVQRQAREDADGALSWNLTHGGFAPLTLLAYPCGCQPMWRRSVHEALGGFDASYAVVGDYDFTLRLCQKWRARRVDTARGVFRVRADSLSSAGQVAEMQRIAQGYRTPDSVLQLYAAEGWSVDTAAGRGHAWLDFATRCLGWLTLWGGQWQARADHALSERMLEAALDTPAQELARQNLELLAYLCSGEWASDEVLTWRLPPEATFMENDNWRWMQPLPSGCPQPTLGNWYETHGAGILQTTPAHLYTYALGLDIAELRERLARLAAGETIVIWGCGDRGRELSRLLRALGYPLSFFIDSNERLQGQERYGLPVRSPEEALGERLPGLILPGTWATESLAQTLAAHGVGDRAFGL